RFFMVLIALIGIVWFGLALPDRTAELAALEDELQFEAELRSSSLLKQVDGFETSAQLLGQTEVIGPVIEEDGQAFFELDILQDTIGAESIYVVERGRAGSIPSGRMSLAKFNLPDWQETLEAAFLGRIGSTSYVNAAGAPLFVYFVPHIDDGPGASGGIDHVIVAEFSLAEELDQWRQSDKRIEVISDDNRTLLANDTPYGLSSQSHQTRLSDISATMVTRSDSPDTVGVWLFRSIVTVLAGLLALFFYEQQSERRRVNAELAEARAFQARQLQEEVATTKTELGQVTDQLRVSENMALIGQLSASLGQDISQPLSAIKNYGVAAKRFMERGNVYKAQENIDSMTELSERISRMVASLRGFASTGDAQLAPLNVKGLVDQAAIDMLDRYPNLRDYCFIETAENMSEDIAITVDKARFMQVLNNLLVTAWENSRDMDEPEVVISLSDRPNNVTIAIDHNGAPTAAGGSALRAATTGEAPGTGAESSLGFTISKSFIEEMKGFLTQKVSMLGGDRFEIIMPKATETPT
ncbi:MAG: hypothetical protein AAGA63_06475, partial [Pseudomonadota bacterium]